MREISFRRNAHAGIGDFNDRLARFAARADFHAATVARIFEGVVEEVGEHLARANAVDRDRARVGHLERDSDALFFGDILVEFDHFAEERGHIDRFAGQFHHAGLGFGDVEQRVEHGVDAIGFLDAIGEGFSELRDLRVTAQGDFGGAAQACQGRAQVVRDVVE
jgi:hypothetical protein